jgi:hypothetical protein
MKKLSTAKIFLIKDLRSNGHTVNEIMNITGAGKGTVSKYINGVLITDSIKKDFELKRFPSKKLSAVEWEKAKMEASKNLFPLLKQSELSILACLYWGEGNKKELNLINSDPFLIKTFVECLYLIGVKKENLKITLRIYEDMNPSKIKKFWANLLSVPLNQISNINILYGKKGGKLEFGMCRIRVKNGGRYFKLIISMIDLLKSHYNSRCSSMDRTRHS